MKRGYLIPVVLILFLTSAAWAQQTAFKSKVLGSPHDINTAGCKSCHASHDGAAATVTGADATTGRILLWDRKFSTVTTFGTYTSPSLTQTPVEIGGNTTLTGFTGTSDRMNSLLCMSCHDGVTTATGSGGATENPGAGSPSSGLGLTNDHPVNMPYSTTNSTLIAPATVISKGLKLYGSSNTMQCSSCHTAHDDTIKGFLRIANDNTLTGLCVTCHQ